MTFDQVKPWLLPVGLIVGVGILAWKLNHEINRADVAVAAAERAEFKLKNIPVAAPATKGQLEAALLRLEALSAQVEKLRKEMPKGTRIVYVQAGKTDPGQAGGTSRDPVPPAADPTKPPLDPNTPPLPACLLRVGDEMDIRVSNAQLNTPNGNAVFTGYAGCYRLTPTVTELFGGKLKYETQIEKPQLEPHWGAGGTFVAGKFGWVVGPAVAPPRFTLLGAELESLFGLGFGADNQWAISASFFGRLPW